MEKEIATLMVKLISIPLAGVLFSLMEIELELMMNYPIIILEVEDLFSILKLNSLIHHRIYFMVKFMISFQVLLLLLYHYAFTNLINLFILILLYVFEE